MKVCLKEKFVCGRFLYYPNDENSRLLLGIKSVNKKMTFSQEDIEIMRKLDFEIHIIKVLTKGEEHEEYERAEGDNII